MAEAFNTVNSIIKDSDARKNHFNVVVTGTKKLIGSFGEFEYSSTTFVNKHTAENISLINQYFGITPHQKLTEGAKVRILKEAVPSSYERAGIGVSMRDRIKKQAVKKYLHSLQFPAWDDYPEEKKVVETLFIEADEDHCHLQFHEKKGDLKINENNYKNNCTLTKIVYVHKGLEKTTADGKEKKRRRHRLKNVHYFCGIYDGDQNQELWKEVYTYIDRMYDLTQVKRIVLMSDGGSWIRAGRDMIHGMHHALDEFHLKKYILKLTRHMKDSAEDARKELCDAIKQGDREEFDSVVQRILDCTTAKHEEKHVREGYDYIISNWQSARTRLAGRSWIIGCSAEGHVSHVLASRISSRPMGWSRHGADVMAHLRAYDKNKGNMIDLVRWQADREEVKLAAGAEDVILSCQQVLNSETHKNGELGKYYDAMQATMSIQDRKKAYPGGKVILF